MAWNVLGLCILVLGATGIVNALSFEFNELVPNPPNILSKPWNYEKPLDRYYSHFMSPHLYRHLKDRNFQYVQHKFEPVDYQTLFKKIPVTTRKPLFLQAVKFHDDLSKLNKITETQATESNENSILASDTYDYVPEDINDCSKTGCIEKANAVASQTMKNETEDENNETERNTPVDSTISESSSSLSELESTDSSKSNQNSTLHNVSEATTNEASNITSSDFATESDISSNQTYSDENEPVTISTFGSSTDEDISINVSISSDGTTLPAQTSENTTDDDGSTDSSTFSFENGTDEVTAASHATTTEAPRSTDASSPSTKEDLTLSPESSSDVSVQNTTISEEKGTSESNIPSQTEFNSSTEVQSTTNQIPEDKSPVSDSTSSTTDEGSFVTSTTDEGSFVTSTTDEGSFVTSTTDESSFVSTSVNVEKTTLNISPTISSKGSTSSKSEITTETISEDHNIKISSIRTARMIVTVVFLMILLIAVTILAVYIFRAKRRAVEYDQLVLLP